ncbi:MAG: hypothetical protein COT85_07240 [Chlamydiae bacterium CG10_big_fil_rev_8_21_14_0_10_42_34]|nr:MAG: hypothetical protein COT85_07240 [Chlamydiae bacterium CG10_big_fil_rev_8_21_14_0_10_42_34]
MKKHGKTFYFLRHAETTWNQKKLCQGTIDIDLSENGVKEATLLAQKLASFPLECICTSPLTRALRTAQMIHKHHPTVPFKILEELKERNWGHMQGSSSSQMYEFEMHEELNPDFVPPLGIETRTEMKERLKKGLEKAFQIHREPLLVSHGRLFIALCELLEVPLIRQVPNLCLIKFCHDGSSWSCQLLSEDLY